MLAWRNWQTRTAQDRMGKPVEVRVLSRAVTSPLRSTRINSTAYDASLAEMVTSCLQLSVWLPTAPSLTQRAFYGRLV